MRPDYDLSEQMLVFFGVGNSCGHFEKHYSEACIKISVLPLTSKNFCQHQSKKLSYPARFTIPGHYFSYYCG